MNELRTELEIGLGQGVRMPKISVDKDETELERHPEFVKFDKEMISLKGVEVVELDGKRVTVGYVSGRDFSFDLCCDEEERQEAFDVLCVNVADAGKLV
jgi:hypothetical protein